MRFPTSHLGFLMVASFPLVRSLQCYHCDLAANISCPGWSR